MIRRKPSLLSSAVVPMVAAAGIAVGSGMMTSQSAVAASGCDYGSASAALPAAQAREGNIVLAASHEKGECAAKNPCAAKKK